jgi:NADH-quinone oxidoreductase subunit M
MLTLIVFLPLIGTLLIALVPNERLPLIRGIGLATGGATLLLVASLWLGFDPAGGYQFVIRVPWIETLGVSYALGLDGLSLPMVALTAVLFFFALVFSWPEDRRAKEYYGWFLFLETACLGVFSALDFFLFYIFWDLILVGMYFIIAIWGHEGARAAALKFFIYTFVGSLALLLGIIGLYLATEPLTTDMATIVQQRPLAGGGWLAHLVFWALLLGLAVKTPLVPVHTWLPPAHADAPAPASAILAGILLKMGTYGFLRFLLNMLPETFEIYAPFVVVLGVISVIYGALAALAQTDLKRLIAYTSINHMGYIVMAVGAVAMVTRGSDAGRSLAVNGAVLQMISHGLITGSLFLFAGVLWRRAATFDIGAFGGLGQRAPVFAGAMSLAAFASLGLPGLSGFVAEFQIFVGTFAIYPIAAAIALSGIVITAGLFLWTIQRLFLGPLEPRWGGMADMALHERLAIFPLLALVVVIGLMPYWILEVIDGFDLAVPQLATAGP